MNKRIYQYKNIYLLIITSLFTGSCSTSELALVVAPLPPTYTRVPHPASLDVGDLVALFSNPDAPKGENYSNTCDEDFQKLVTLSKSKEETQKGITELVKADPVHYHWCFYGKLLKLDEVLKNHDYIDEKQKSILNYFEFLVPIARAFSVEFHDTRYLRLAVLKYKRLSETTFYRRLDLTPVGTNELVQPENPFGLWRNPSLQTPVLEKYHLGKDLNSIDTPSVEGPPPTASNPK